MARLILPYQSVYDLNGHPLPGAKMYFYESGTVTLKDTYSDEALTTPNTNPVIADSQGQFGDIFLSGAYSVKLDDADDVTQPDYPAEIEAAADTSSTVLLTGAQTVAGAKTFTDKFAVKADTAIIELEENDAPADNRLYQMIASAEQFIMRVANDARDTFSSIFTVDRTGTTVDTVNFLSTNLQHNGTPLVTSLTTSFDDSGFEIFDNGDNTKKIAFEVSGVTTGTTRTTTMPDKDLTFDYGSYNPTATIVANIDLTAGTLGLYTRVGNVVTVSGYVQVDATAVSTRTQLTITLPISGLSGSVYGSGAASKFTAPADPVYIDSSGSEASFDYFATVNTLANIHFTFAYKVA